MEVWGSWQASPRSFVKEVGEILIRAIFWNICLEQNNCMFHSNIHTLRAIIIKIDHMFLFWLSIVRKVKMGKFEDSIIAIRRSLEFMGSRSKPARVSDLGEEASTQEVG